MLGSTEKARFETASARANAIFDNHPDGIFLSDLVGLLRLEDFSQSEASSAADHLIKRQAHMNYETGFLTHLPHRREVP